jgi:hypothetical protein
VILGMKIHPTEHPRWGLDHFVLAVGIKGDGIVVNTTWGHDEARTLAQLGSTEPGLSLKNAYGTFWALAIRGLKAQKSTSRARVSSSRASGDQIDVVVVCDDVKPGTVVKLEQRPSLRDGTPDSTTVFDGSGNTFATEKTVDRGSTTAFRCVREASNEP